MYRNKLRRKKIEFPTIFFFNSYYNDIYTRIYNRLSTGIIITTAEQHVAEAQRRYTFWIIIYINTARNSIGFETRRHDEFQ